MRHRRYVLFWFLVTLTCCVFAQVQEQLDEFGEAAFCLNPKFEKSFMARTGYTGALLVSRYSQFLGEKYVYYYLECSATFYKNDRKCVDHRAFLIRRLKDDHSGWHSMEVFAVGSVDIPFVGYENDRDIDALLEAVGTLVTPEFIKDGLCE